MPQSPHDLDEWLYTEYFSFLTASTSASLDYLHKTITWSVTISGGSLAVIVARQSFPDRTSLFLLLAVELVLTHFFVRAAKAYLNVMRFSTLQRHVLAARCGMRERLSQDVLVNRIQELHFSWMSPLRRSTVILKMLVEFGFGYVYFLVTLPIAYVIVKTGPTVIDYLAIGVVLFLALLEIWVALLLSPYLRSVHVDDLAESLF